MVQGVGRRAGYGRSWRSCRTLEGGVVGPRGVVPLFQVSPLHHLLEALLLHCPSKVVGVGVAVGVGVGVEEVGGVVEESQRRE